MKKLILAISTIFCLSGCNYLDIVPDDTPLLEDAFKNEQTAEGFMYSCYAQIPDYTNFRSNIAWLTTPEVVYSYHWIDAWFASIGLQQGKYSASNPVVDVWRPSYRGIRQCYTFLDNMEGVPGVNISPEDLVQRKKEWKGKLELLLSRAKQNWQDSWNISAPFVRKTMPLRQKTAERKNSIPLRWAVR